MKSPDHFNFSSLFETDNSNTKSYDSTKEYTRLNLLKIQMKVINYF